MNRRTFLAGTGATLFAPRVSKMHFGFTSYVWGRAWDIPTLIANCVKMRAAGLELRTSTKSAHGVELEIDDARRREVKKQFEGGPVTLLGLATGEKFDQLDPAEVGKCIENAKGYAKLSHDIGGRGIRVFPNDIHKEVPLEKTAEQIARALNIVGKYAADYGQKVRLENHGTAGRLTTLKMVMDRVPLKNVCIKLNCEPRDAVDGSFPRNFNLVKDRLGDTLHMKNLTLPNFPYQLQCDLLVDMGWDGWWLVEDERKVTDAVQTVAEQNGLWLKMIANSLKRA